MDESNTSAYLEAYYQNERDANRQMSYACAFIAIVLTAVLIGYITQLFKATELTFIIVCVSFPIIILVLLSTLFWVKTKRNGSPAFKYFVVFLFVGVMMILNIILPKHGLLGLALCIVLTTHYYNPKMCRAVFIAIVIGFFFTTYAGMFLGEYDPHLLTGETDELNNVITHWTTSQTWPDTPAGRYEFIKYLNAELGTNRFISVLLFYYLPRSVLLFLIFLVSNSLNKRTYKLFIDEIKVNSEQEKVSVELNVAKDIQLNTLPSSFVTSEDIEIQAELKAAKEVGGDFYDYKNIDDSHVAIVIGDVSGKGIPAAMFMMKVITCFKNFIQPNTKPSEILRKVNAAIYEGNTNTMFVTCFLAIVNTKTGLVEFANAGHNPPIIGQKGHFEFLKCNSGFLLGTMEECFVKDEQIQFNNGDVITLYTDGVTEARNKKGEFYGEKRLLDVYNSREYNSMLELHHTLKDDIAIFVENAPQSDDLTYLSLKFHGDKVLYKESQFEATKENIQPALDLVREFVSTNIHDKTLINNIIIVGDELISNIVKYAYKDGTGEIYIRLMFNLTKKEFFFTIIDMGVEFNQLEVNNNPLEKDDDRPAGGLGILMVKRIMDSYTYDRINGKNILVFVKKL